MGEFPAGNRGTGSVAIPTGLRWRCDAAGGTIRLCSRTGLLWFGRRWWCRAVQVQPRDDLVGPLVAGSKVHSSYFFFHFKGSREFNSFVIYVLLLKNLMKIPMRAEPFQISTAKVTLSS